MPWLRRSVNRAMSRIISRQAGRPLPDTQSGFRLVHLSTWAALPLAARRFEVESEMLLAFLAAGERVEFVPARVRPGGRPSHISPLADTLRWLHWWQTLHRPDRRPVVRRAGPANRDNGLARQNDIAVPV